jgi:hypothetical protein
MKDGFMSGRLAGLLVLISAVSMLVLSLLFAYAPYLRSDDSSEADVASRSAIGFAGLKELLALSGIASEIDHGPMMRGNAHPSLVILTPDITTSAADIAGYDYSAPTLIILPKWTTAAILEKPQWVTKTGILNDNRLNELVAKVAPGVGITYKAGSAHNVQIFAGPAAPFGFAPFALKHIEEIKLMSGTTSVLGVRDLSLPNVLAADEHRSLLGMVRHKGQPIYILTEPDLMNNHGLVDADTARAAVMIVAGLRRGDGPVRFDVTLNGMSRDPGLLHWLFEPPLVGTTVCALLAALLIGLHAASRFGSPQPATRIFARGKTMLAVNTAELLRIMRREGAMAQRYVHAARELVLVRLGARRHSATEQDELLARLERQNGLNIRYTQLAKEAGEAQNVAALLRIARKAYIWRKGITRGY